MKDFWSGRTISLISLISFLAVLIIILLSNRYMNMCLLNESDAQQNRSELKQLGQSLSDASDKLTDDVRKYAITGEIDYLYEYWHDVENTKTRDKIIGELKSYNPPEVEKQLLSEAKNYSDLLIETETRAMKLALMSQNLSADDYSYDEELYEYVKFVMQYNLPDEDLNLSNQDMAGKSVAILYDDNYADFKYLISSTITEFQDTMNDRLDKTVSVATKGMYTGSVIQIVCSGFVLVFIAILLIMIHKLYTKPLNSFTAELNKVNDSSDANELTEIRVKPAGVYELKEFGRMFNKLAVILQKELETRKQAELEMKISRDEADKANNAKSEFLARMSHELRTPLNAIIGYMYLLEKCELGKKERNYCDKISLSSEILLGIISDILDFSKIESGNLILENIYFNLTTLIQEVYVVMENSIRQKNLRFNLNIDGDIPVSVKGDPVRLRQVLINLLGNALKFTLSGEINLTASCESIDDKTCCVRFSVSDTGIGIKDSEIEKILEPFVQSDASVTRKYGGTGLGLSICNTIIQIANSGESGLEITSQEGEGSEFSFCICFENGNTVVEKDNNQFDDTHEIGGKKTILLIDDNEINLDMESEIIQSFGVSVDIANSGKKSLEMIELKQYDMILVDIRMPDMDGYQVASCVRKNKKYNRVPIIALTADAVADTFEKSIKSGMNDYVTKPLKPHKLCEIMRKYFDIALNNPEMIFSDKSKFFDYDECLHNLNGNEKMLLKLVQKFLNSQHHNAEYIQMHIESRCLLNACSILHNVIGTTGNLCCHKLYDLSIKFKDELHRGNTDLLPDFLDVWNKTFLELEKYKSEHIMDSTIEFSGDYSELYNQLLILCNDFDISAEDLFASNIYAFRDNMNRDVFAQLKEAIEKYDFSEASKILNG